MFSLPFIKMHGLKNDFVIVDRRVSKVSLTPAHMRLLCDRRAGVGCDQLVMLDSPHSADADLRVSFFNSDGTESGACGNATRCVAWLLMEERAVSEVRLESQGGLLRAWRSGEGVISVLMPSPRFAASDIPLSRAVDSLHVPLSVEGLSDGVAVNVGNPHIVFFVEDVDAILLSNVGPRIEHDALFPERVNVEVVQKIGEAQLKMRVWERGSGETLACGTGACAAAVAAIQRGLVVGREVNVVLPGGELDVQWSEDDSLIMRGAVAEVFRGVIAL